MTPWVAVAALSALAAFVLAVTDGALLSAGPSSARTAVRDAERGHRAVALGRMLAHLLTGAALSLWLSRAGLPRGWAIVVAAGLLLLDVMVVEGVGRAAGYAGGPKWIARLAPVVGIASVLLLPVSWVSAALERAIGGALAAADDVRPDRRSGGGAEQFREVVEAEADVSAAEAALLHGVFSLGQTQVQEIMVPRVDVVGIDRNAPWSEVLDRVRSSEHARFPVYDETLDNVIGILYSKDLLPSVVADSEPDDWPALVRPTSFIPATKTLDDQLRDFKAQRTHIALVMDEYGGTAGLVTIEDVLEEIVGEIRDEYDVEEPAIEREGQERFWIAGRVTLADLSELVEHDFQRDGITTVGGLVYDTFGRVPRAGESTTLDGFRIVVERVRRRRIERVYFERHVDAEPLPESA